jgi:hypothetical protein
MGWWGSWLQLARFDSANLVGLVLISMTWKSPCRVETILWRAGYAPADRQTSWGLVLHPYRPSTQLGVYSTTLVQYLYISCYLSDNKPSYLLSRLLPQYDIYDSANCYSREKCTRRATVNLTWDPNSWCMVLLDSRYKKIWVASFRWLVWVKVDTVDEWLKFRTSFVFQKL